MACRHRHRVPTWRRSGEREIASALHCYDCGVSLSLGPSNDEPWYVQEEISAARMVSADACGGHEITDLLTADPDELLISWPECWLALEIAGRLDETDTWDWDPTQPVAGQYEEHLRAKMHAQDEALRLEAWKLNAPVREANRWIMAQMIAGAPEDTTPTPPVIEDDEQPEYGIAGMPFATEPIQLGADPPADWQTRVLREVGLDDSCHHDEHIVIPYGQIARCKRCGVEWTVGEAVPEPVVVP